MGSSINLQVYIYPSCSTCKKAINWLKDKSISCEIVDIVESPPPRSIIEKGFLNCENRKKLFNTSGISYRQIGAKNVNKMSEEEAITALSLDGKLIKRPFLVLNQSMVLTGFNVDKWEIFFRERA